MFTMETLSHAGQTFLMLFGELFGLFIGISFAFAVIMGLILDAAGFEKEIKNVSVRGGQQNLVSWENLEGTFWQKQLQAFKYSIKDAFGLFKGVLLYLILGAGIGAFIYEFIPTELLANFAGAANLWAVPVAAVIGIPMYIRTETMIPIAGILIAKGVAPGVMIALILGGAGASIPEVSLLSSIFKKKMVVAFVLCIFAVAVITGYVFNFIL